MNVGPVPRGQCQGLLFAGGKQIVQLLLKRVITDAIIELRTGLHGVNHVLLVTFGADRVVYVLRGLVGGAEGRRRVELDGDANRRQLVAGEQRCGTELGDVGQDRHVQFLHETLVRRQVVGGLGEDAVGARFQAGAGAIDRRVQALFLERVGARDDKEVLVGAGVGGGLDAVHHLRLGDDFLIGAVAAALLRHLVFQVHGAGAGAAPTASAVVADIIDVARMISSPESSVPALAFQDDSLSDVPILPMDEVESAYYLRITADDKVGVLADITEILGDCRINIEAIIQKEPRGVDTDSKLIQVPVIILTHEIREATMNEAIRRIEALDGVSEAVTRIRVFRISE